ncbi:helix-turn-helix domain containing protein [Sinomicrobium kalidii]|uniref:helix-turn-helix domain-containing protein n=1 Tax=Sinomicrobium kalidii TaxID=2900738 RepID=UPI001E2B9CDE|nr:helix-turn-helix domain-containing protein [Sinomicrobium kalidii]UGU16290.1 helix-turn-helix domain containing protein [Sinomicrobium kalidii]
MKKKKKTGREQEPKKILVTEAFSVDDVLQNLKDYFGFKTNKDLAEFLGVRPNTISTWKKRNSIDYERLITIGKLHKLDFNRLFSHDVYEPKGIIVVPLELQYQYVSKRNDKSFIANLPRYHFPFSPGENTRAFQVTDFSAISNFKGVSYVIGERVYDTKSVVEGSTYVFVNTKQGIFIGRADLNPEDDSIVYVMTNDNKIPPGKVKMTAGNIAEIWKVTNVVSHDFID